jgi:type I restriction enzyme, S subunit
MNIRQTQLPKDDAQSLPKGWEIKTLGEIADVEYGFTDKSTEEGDYRYIRITDIDNNGGLISTQKKYLKHSKEAKEFLIRDKDLLMARTGATFAKVLLYEDFEPSVFASYLIRITFKEKIENKLYWYFTKTKSYWEQANSLASGAAQPHFNGAAVKQVIFSYPKSLPEQQRIVAILDEAFAVIERSRNNVEQNLKNAKELFESYLQSVFENKGEDWEEKTLGEAVDSIMTGPFGTMLHKSDYVEDGVPVVNPQNIVNGQIVSLQKTMIDETTFNRLKKYALKLGDIVIARRGEMGRCAITKSENVGWLCGTGSFVIRVNQKKANSEFLNIILSSDTVKKELEKSSIGATMSNLNQSILSELSLSIPPLKTQQTIVQKLDALLAETKKLEAIYQQKINDLEELKKSVLQKAFAGELVSAKKVWNVIAFPVTVPNISATDLQAGIVATAFELHRQKGKLLSFHHVKAEKIVHLAESILEIDLERMPFKDAAGPNDFPHAKKVESRAKKAGFFTVQKTDNFYNYQAGNQMPKLMDKTKLALADKYETLIELIDLMAPMDTQQAEIFATTFAAWNNLLIEGVEITDKAIVYEARENWHADKLRIPRERFFGAIKWMREKNITPKGIGKKVLAKQKKQLKSKKGKT